MSDRIIIGDKQFDTLVAITDKEAAQGLMFKSWPPPVMAFPCKSCSVRKFWMKNTTSPLDIVFCRQGQIIGIFEGEPLSLENVGPDEPSDLILEFPRGTMKKNNIVVGDPVKLSYSISTLAKKFGNYLFCN